MIFVFQETDAVFVMTNMILTPRQAQTNCPEDPKFKHVHCKTDEDCPKLVPVKNGNGIELLLYTPYIHFKLIVDEWLAQLQTLGVM